MGDNLNELGKSIRNTRDKADNAAKRDGAQFAQQEEALDIFDEVVPFTMYFKVPKQGKKVTADLNFNLPPPGKGLGNCCGDCYCAVCEVFPSDDEAWGSQILLQRPYVEGSVRLMMSDFLYMDGITEVDPEAGIVGISNYVLGAGYTITICYVYAYGDCTTNAPDIPDPEDCFLSYSFDDVSDRIDQTSNSDGWGDGWLTFGQLQPAGEFVPYNIDTATGVDTGEAFLAISPNNLSSIVNSQAVSQTNTQGSWTTTIGFTVVGRFRIDSTDTDPLWTIGVQDGTGGFDRWVIEDGLLNDYITSGVTTSPIAKSFVNNTYYRFKWEYTPNSTTNSIKFWLDSDDEPSDWDIEANNISITPDSQTFVYFALNSPGSAPPTYIYFDWIYFDPCTVNEGICPTFDDFTRTVSAGGFGTATNGVAWTTSTGGSYASVTGTVGRFESSENGTLTALYWNDDEAADAPWWVSSSAVEAVMQVRFRFDFAVPGSGEGYVRLALSPGGVEGLINISSLSGNYGFSSDSISKLDWVQNQWYIAEWYYNGAGTTTFVVYAEDSTPGTLSTKSSEPDAGYLGVFYINATDSGPARPIEIDSIDFCSAENT